MKPLNIKEVVRGHPEEKLNMGVLEAHDIKIERNIMKSMKNMLIIINNFIIMTIMKKVW